MCKDAIAEATEAVSKVLGRAPEVIIRGDTDVMIRYVPSHLYYMLNELLKNSMRGILPVPQLLPVCPFCFVLSWLVLSSRFVSFCVLFRLVFTGGPRSLC